ncbi:MAG: hypothetical protein IPI06_14620 [Gammaproteobacteria bacterium]|nr:hypothetical protein [Gammaproteobacteria bacterium]
MTENIQFLVKAEAQQRIDPRRPVSEITANVWHDKVGGPRDTWGRRLWTPEVCDRIREARSAGKVA